MLKWCAKFGLASFLYSWMGLFATEVTDIQGSQSCAEIFASGFDVRIHSSHGFSGPSTDIARILEQANYAHSGHFESALNHLAHSNPAPNSLLGRALELHKNGKVYFCVPHKHCPAVPFERSRVVSFVNERLGEDGAAPQMRYYSWWHPEVRNRYDAIFSEFFGVLAAFSVHQDILRFNLSIDSPHLLETLSQKRMLKYLKGFEETTDNRIRENHLLLLRAYAYQVARLQAMEAYHKSRNPKSAIHKQLVGERKVLGTRIMNRFKEEQRLRSRLTYTPKGLSSRNVEAAAEEIYRALLHTLEVGQN